MTSSNELDDSTFRLIAAVLGCSGSEEHRCYFPGELKDEGRFAWGTLGDVIEATPFLPITINVPDMFYGMYEMFNRVTDYFFGGESNNESTPRIWDILQAVEDALPEI